MAGTPAKPFPEVFAGENFKEMIYKKQRTVVTLASQLHAAFSFARLPFCYEKQIELLREIDELNKNTNPIKTRQS